MTGLSDIGSHLIKSTMKNIYLRTFSLSIVAALGLTFGQATFQPLVLGPGLSGAATLLSPLTVDIPAIVPEILSDGDFTTGFEAADRHWFGSNLSANGPHTHNGNNYASTVNRIGSWSMTSGDGTGDYSNLAFDSTAFTITSPIITLEGDEALALYGGGLMPSILIGAPSGEISIRTTGGEVYIPNLALDSGPGNVMTYDPSTDRMKYAPFEWGTYTPTYSSESNISTLSISDAQFIRVGNVVTVSGKMEIEEAGTGDTWFRMTIPIASASANTYEAGGTCVGVDGDAGLINMRDPDKVEILYKCTEAASAVWAFHFTYIIT